MNAETKTAGKSNLAAVVLEAAKRDGLRPGSSGNDEIKQNGHNDGSTGENKSASNNTEKRSLQDGSVNSLTNGHLLRPFSWQSNRALTASPEPIQPVQNGDATPSSSTKASSPAVKAPKKQLSGASSRPSQRRQLSAHFSDDTRRSGSYSRHGLTSESSRDNGHGESSTGSQILSERNVLRNVRSAGSENSHSGLSAGGSGPLRGPFSRLDSSRGQSLLARQSQSQSQSRHASLGSDGHAATRRSTSDSHGSATAANGDNEGVRPRRSSFSRVARSVGLRTGLVNSDEEVEEPERSRDDAEGRSQQLLPPHQPDAMHETSRPQVMHAGTSPAGGAGFLGPAPTASRARPRTGLRAITLGDLRRSSNTSNDEEGGPARNRRDKDDQGGFRSNARSRWAALREKLRQEKKPEELEKGLTGKELVTDLSTGLMSVMMLKMAFDRDEHDQHRVPVLLNYLKLRITDSVYPFHNTHAIFRIELEYGDGLLKWVIYRELRDFVNLHAHYRVANVKQGLNKLPPFPRTSIPYFNKLVRESKERGGNVPGKAEFAKSQRESLEDYLLRLIRSVMFRPEANRLCKFLELSAISIHLATKGGVQGKQGYLRVLSSGASRRRKPGFHPLDFKSRHEPKWFVVRESYILAVDETYETKIWDCFLIDEDFAIDRPHRLYRQGLGLFSDGKAKTSENDNKTNDTEGTEALPEGLREYEGYEGVAGDGVGDPNDPSTTTLARDDPKRLKNTSLHTFYIRNSERKIKLVAKTERQMDQFIASIEKTVANSIWAGKNRFGSFAPIRLNVAAQWLVDGRDYFWNLSRAILLAKERVYIHDWWLSPELYLRRPPAENGRWRLDRLLQKKAEEGVQIFIIIYQEVSNDFTPVDSAYTKYTLTDLHPNIMVQRSPSHAQTRTLLWSHHEKMCVVDDTIGFMGGLDLCFGRWDTPSHSMIDDGPAIDDDLDLPENRGREMSKDRETCQVWPGKDYANSRVSDFSNLHKPFEDVFDRAKVPREPWHDIGLQIIGQPARDLCRHFIQRWNLLLRSKNHKRFMPFLLPPADFTAKELADLQLTGTCETQICRSAGPWSIGTPNKIEHSIQTAYIKAIQLSEHFVYIENQFFITSTEVVGVSVENNIGNALVERIIRAHRDEVPWRAIILIPLEPGYPMPVDHPDAGSVRLIMACQFQSISRGEHSIFARLRREGIDPNEYISFYSLRSWARMQDGTLATSDIYIHAKCMIVDDRIALIGSANINERSQRGDRDSELLCVVRDTDMMDSTMAGKPFQVGRFAHTLRIRLMREHLGIDVDDLEAKEAAMDLMNREPVQDANDIDVWDPTNEQVSGDQDITSSKGHRTRFADTAGKAGTMVTELVKGASEAVGIGADRAMPNVREDAASLAHPGKREESGHTTLSETGAPSEGDRIVTGKEDGKGYASTVVPTLEEKTLREARPATSYDAKSGDNRPSRSPQKSARFAKDVKGGGENMDDLSQTLGQHTTMISPNASDTRQFAREDEHTTHQLPGDVQHASEHQSSAKADVASPTASTVRDAQDHPVRGHRRFGSAATTNSLVSPSEKSVNGVKSNEQIANSNKATDAIRKSLAGKMNQYSLPTKAPYIDAKKFADPLIDSFYKDMWIAAAVRNTQIYRKVFRCTPDDLVTTWAMLREWSMWGRRHEKLGKGPATGKTTDSPSNGPGTTPVTDEDPEKMAQKSPSDNISETEQKKRSKQQMEEAFTEDEIDQMEALLQEVTGQLVIYPTRYLEGESAGGNFLWAKDRIPPIAIYD